MVFNDQSQKALKTATDHNRKAIKFDKERAYLESLHTKESNLSRMKHTLLDKRERERERERERAKLGEIANLGAKDPWTEQCIVSSSKNG